MENPAIDPATDHFVEQPNALVCGTDTARPASNSSIALRRVPGPLSFGLNTVTCRARMIVLTENSDVFPMPSVAVVVTE